MESGPPTGDEKATLTKPSGSVVVDLEAGSSVHQPRSASLYQGTDTPNYGMLPHIFICLSWFIYLITFPVQIFCGCTGLLVLKEYERAVVFRLGRSRSGNMALGPGMFVILPFIDRAQKISMRTEALNVNPQQVMTKDSLTVTVDAVVYMRVQDATKAILNVNDHRHATQMLAQTTLRNTLGTLNLQQVLSGSTELANTIRQTLDAATDDWGIVVERVEMKDVSIPHQLERAMAAEAEATREAKSKVINAEGEKAAATIMRQAAEQLDGNPTALQLRFFQTLHQISAEKNSTIVLPFPVQMLDNGMGPSGGSRGGGGNNTMGQLATALAPALAEHMAAAAQD